MQVVSRYCSRCQKKIAPRDLEMGHAITHKHYLFCRDCIRKHPPLQKLKKALELKEAKRASKKEKEKEEASPSQSSKELDAFKQEMRNKKKGISPQRMGATSSTLSVRAIPTESSQSSAPLIIIICLLLGGVVGFLALSSGTGTGQTQTDKDGVEQDLLDQWKSRLQSIEQQRREGHPLSVVLANLQSLLEEDGLKSSSIYDKVNSKIEHVTNEMARRKMKTIRDKINTLIGRKEFEVAMKKLESLPRKFTQIPYCQEQITQLRQVINTQLDSKRVYEEIRRKARRLVADKKVEKAIDLYRSYPQKYHDSPYYQECLAQIRELKSVLEKMEDRRARLALAKRDYEDRMAKIEEYLKNHKYGKAMAQTKNFSDDFKDTKWAKMLVSKRRDIRNQFKRTVHRGKIPIPPRATSLQDGDSLSNWTQRGPIKVRSIDGIISISNQGSNPAYLLTGNEKWQDYRLTFLARLPRGKAQVLVRSRRENGRLNATRLTMTPSIFPSGTRDYWHYCMIQVYRERVVLIVMDSDRKEPEKKIVARTSRGKIGFLVEPGNKLEVKNVAIEVLSTASSNSNSGGNNPPKGIERIFAGSLNGWSIVPSSSRGIWQVKNKILVARNNTSQISRIYYNKTCADAAVMVRIKVIQGKCNFLLRATSQGRGATMVPLTGVIPQSQQNQWKNMYVMFKGSSIHVFDYAKSIKKAYRVTGSSPSGRFGFSLYPGSHVEIQAVVFRKIP